MIGFVFPECNVLRSGTPQVKTLDALLDVIGKYATPLEFSIAEVRYNDMRRADTLIGVTKHFKQVQSRHQGPSEISRLKKWAEAARPADAYSVGVRGFGLSGFQYLRILLGAQTVRTDVHIRRFVSEAVKHSVTDERAIELFETAAKHLDWRLTALDYAVWDRRARESGT